MSEFKKDNKISETLWHGLEMADVFDKLNTSESGLTDEETEKRRAEFGANILPSSPAPSLALIFFRQFLNPLIYILTVAGLASLFLREFSESFFIFGVIFLNAIIGAWQENKAEKTASSLKKLIKINTVVVRNGMEREINSDELVPGDIVKLSSGGKIPADIRLIESKNLSVDESLLTGESLAVAKDAVSSVLKDALLSARFNMVFAGTSIATGRATGIVVKTGLNTEVGKIVEVIASSKSEKPPLILRMEAFTKKIGYIILIACFVLMAISLGRGMGMVEVFFLAVALAVSAIPEGLPVSLTVALSIAAFRMSKRKVVVRKLNAVDGLGSCTLIASDKTGTLTVNQQTAKSVWLPSGAYYEIQGEGYNGLGKIKKTNGKEALSDSKDFLELVLGGALNNEGKLYKKSGKWRHAGDSIDIAFLALAFKNKINLDKIKTSYPQVGIKPYESENRYSAVEVSGEKNKNIIFAKGAIDVLLKMSSHFLVGGKKVKINNEIILKQVEEMAEKGLRVIALAKKINARQDDKVLEEKDFKNMIFLGLVGFIDPLRSDSAPAVEKCAKAGIKVIMITGDHPITALAIAKELKIADDKSQVITGQQIEKMGPQDTPEFYEKILSCRVFAGVSPLQKYQVVEALSKSGHYVAVTGDGANDAPALKRANLGVAMGSGTDVAKETASMILINDDFSSIVAGIEEGRFAYDNVRKVIYLLISTGAAEIFLFAFAIFSGLPLPLFAVQLLWLNLVTNGIQDKALAFEGGEPETMSRPPRSPKEGIFNPLMVQQVLVSGLVIGFVAFISWVVFLKFFNLPQALARNYLFLLMVLFENFHVFNCRSEHHSVFKMSVFKNKFLLAVVVLAQAVHIFAMHNPFLAKILNVSPISPKDWLILLGVASTVLFSSEIFKAVKRKNLNNKKEPVLI